MTINCLSLRFSLLSNFYGINMGFEQRLITIVTIGYENDIRLYRLLIVRLASILVTPVIESGTSLSHERARVTRLPYIEYKNNRRIYSVTINNRH